MKAYELRQFGLEDLALVERDISPAGGLEVLVKFHAASLNYRDLMFAKGLYSPKAKLPAVLFRMARGTRCGWRKCDTLEIGRPCLPDFHAGLARRRGFGRKTPDGPRWRRVGWSAARVRRGRKRKYDADIRHRIAAAACSTPPQSVGTHWSLRTLARHLGVGVAVVQPACP